MLSTVNGYHASLRQAAFERVRTQRCFMDRVVSVCFNVSDAIGLCLNAPPVPPAQFRSGPYASLLWAKWYFIADALLVAHTTLWIDSDVVLLQNPWAALVPQRQDPHVAPYHIQFQAERPISNPRWLRGEQMCLPVASSGINGGLLLVRSAALATRMARLRPNQHEVSNSGALDQDYLRELLASADYSYCSLPAAFYSHLWSIGSARRAWQSTRQRSGNNVTVAERLALALPLIQPCELLTVHANGVSSRRQKLQVMRAALEKTRGCPTRLPILSP